MRGLALMLSLLLLSPLDGVGPPQDPPPTPGLSGSKHDFSQEPWTAGDLCIACHARERSDLPAEAPLWNRSADVTLTLADALQDRGQRRTVPYRDRRPQPYRSDHRAWPGPSTMICMRCHDGTVAADMVGGLAAPISHNRDHPAFFTTGHGGSNHPVGVEYPQDDPGFRPLHAIVSEGRVPLPGGRVECVSCHDPHNEAGARYMLVKSNERSALCLTCHNK